MSSRMKIKLEPVSKVEPESKSLSMLIIGLLDSLPYIPASYMKLASIYQIFEALCIYNHMFHHLLPSLAISSNALSGPIEPAT